MPSFYNLIDRMANMVISVVTPDRPSSPPPPYTSPPPTPPHLNRHHRRGYESSSSTHRRESSRYPCSFSFADNRPAIRRRSSSASASASNDNPNSGNHRYYRTARQAKNVHWGHITEIPAGSLEPSAPGLSNFHNRQNRTTNYVYSTDNYNNSDSSISSTDSILSTYEEQRYPNQWYSRSPSPSSSQTQPQPKSQTKFQPHHRTSHPRKPILKPPTPTDDELLIRNLCAMIHLSDQRLEYTYEYLSGILLVGDDMLDTLLQAGEISMREDAGKRAFAMGATAGTRMRSKQGQGQGQGLGLGLGFSQQPKLPKIRAGEGG
ncbi:hypothetical protein BDW59DRAFT_161668 [Aspergillus cavernicola]|uniref:Uncharacterized protein n=1 Tax=Aspergillus cavernicola TaxID=176166 RepID=A0ABR4ICG5_9EURO